MIIIENLKKQIAEEGFGIEYIDNIQVDSEYNLVSFRYGSLGHYPPTGVAFTGKLTKKTGQLKKNSIRKDK